MKTFDEIYALATSPLHAEYAENFTHPRLSWGVGVTQGVAVAMQEMQAEIDALKAQRDVAIKHIAEWCVAIQQNGAGWDDWDEYYKKACCRDNALPEIRGALNAAIAKARGDL